MAKTWTAFYFDGKVAKRRKAVVRLLKGGLSIRHGRSKPLVWPYGEIREAKTDQEGPAVRLERGGLIPEALLFSEASILQALPLIFPASRSHASRFKRTVLAGLAILGMGLAFHFFIIPGMANTLARHFPDRWEKNLGDSALKIMAPSSSRRMAPALQEAVDGIVSRLAATDPGHPEFKVVIVENPAVNAFALPGGSILVMSGLLKKTRNPGELAGVLAHEMQHVIRHHAMRRVLENSETGLLLSVISGDASGAIFGAQAALTMAQIRYSRADEAEADHEGMRMLIKAGMDPKDMLSVYEMLKKSEKLPSFVKFISTHPGIDERIADLKALAKDSHQKPRPIILPKGRTWKSLLKGI